MEKGGENRPPGETKKMETSAANLIASVLRASLYERAVRAKRQN